MEEMDNRDRIAKRERKKHKKSDDFKIKDWVKIIGSAFVIAFLITQFVFSATVVDGNSMQDTLQHHDRLFIRKLGVSVDTLKRGDIIVFHAPDDNGKDYIKRVVAFPNEYVQIENGMVYINGKRLEEPYINTQYTHITDEKEWYVGENELFVLGDNRIEGMSKDSRYFGPIKGDSIVGKAFFRFFPLTNMKSF